MKGPNEEIGKAPLGLSLSLFSDPQTDKNMSRESPEFHMKFVKFEESTKCSREAWLGYLGLPSILDFQIQEHRLHVHFMTTTILVS